MSLMWCSSRVVVEVGQFRESLDTLTRLSSLAGCPAQGLICYLAFHVHDMHFMCGVLVLIFCLRSCRTRTCCCKQMLCESWTLSHTLRRVVDAPPTSHVPFNISECDVPL